LAAEVATELSAHGALEAHARDELGLPEERRARPLQAAGASALSFGVGAVLPLLAIGLFGPSARFTACVLVTVAALGGLGALGANLGGAPEGRAAARVVFWGVVAMGVTSAIGVLIG
jgi:VIT1/CCC1 family predicted Fe2+/Mn2+ transporter